MQERAAAVGATGQWNEFASLAMRDHAELFSDPGPIVGARAPGRLDVMGGVVDYSGGTVLQATLGQATMAAAQERTDGMIHLRSLEARGQGLQQDVVIPVSALIRKGMVASFTDAHASLAASPASRWAAYAGGCLHVLAASGWLAPERVHGLSMLISSNVPIGSGVSSSAALEVSCMAALVSLLDIKMEGIELARLCQAVEHHIVGAPCGIMDQVTSAMGQQDSLLVLRCQPHDILGHTRIPRGWHFVGIDSGVKHAVAGRDYGRARAATHMGFEILRSITKCDWDGYLCNVSPDVWRPWHEAIPEHMTGAAFLEQYGPLSDPVSCIDPAESYHVRAAAEHSVAENNRVREFLALAQLAGDHADESIMVEAGHLMLTTHESFSHQLELGSKETDLLVELAMAHGPSEGIYGAKITGGGSGGTVAILCSDACSDDTIGRIRLAYRERTGIEPGTVGGSSPGAVSFGARIIK